MIEELGALNEKFYELYGRLYENAELLTSKQSELMAEKLLTQYKAEYERLQLNADIVELEQLYTVKQRRAALIPRARRFLFWHRENRAAQVIDREIQTEITRFFNNREKALERLIEALDGENAAPDEDDEAANGQEQPTPEAIGQDEAATLGETQEHEETATPTPENAETHEETDEPDGATITANSN